MSHKSNIYAHYHAQATARNDAIGGDPEFEHTWMGSKREYEIQACPRSHSWGVNGKQGYVLPDGRIAEIRWSCTPGHLTIAIFKDERHHSNYRDVMGMNNYFEG